MARVWRQLAGNTVGKKKNVGRWETRRRLSLDQVPRKPTDWQLFFLLPGLPLCSRLSCQHLHFSVEPRSPPGPRAGSPLRSSCTPTTAAANALRSSQVAPTSRWHRSSRAQKPPPPLPNVSETKNVRRRIRLGGMDCTSRGNLLLTFLEKQLKTSWLETLEAVIDRADWNQNSFYRGARRGARRAKRHAKKEAAHRPIYHQTSDRRLSSDRDAHKVVPPRTYIKVCCCCSVT